MASVRQRGQSTTETMIMVSFLFALLWGTIHFGMLAATKQFLNYAAFVSARAGMVHASPGSTSPSTEEGVAAFVALDNIRWTTSVDFISRETWSAGGKARKGVEVRYRFPVAFPGFPNPVTVKGFSPLVVQPDVSERGDNAD